MQYNIKACLTDGSPAFEMTTCWVPNKGDEIEVNSYIFRVDTVRYCLYEGSTYHTNVKLILTRVR